MEFFFNSLVTTYSTTQSLFHIAVFLTVPTMYLSTLFWLVVTALSQPKHSRVNSAGASTRQLVHQSVTRLYIL